jgi:hypothetical protein
LGNAAKGKMTKQAKIFLGTTVTVGAAVLARGIGQWSTPDLLRFSVYLLLGCVAATLKVKLPGLTSNMSASFLFVLIGVADFTFTETLIVGCTAALVQSLWKVRSPKPVHALFNVTSWAVCIEITYWVSHRVVAGIPNALIVLLPFAAFLFFITHTGFVAAIISLTTPMPFKTTWHEYYFWTFPYYLVGAAIAGAFTVASRTAGWRVSLAVLPLMYLVYECFRAHIKRAPQAEHTESRVRQALALQAAKQLP